MSQKQIAHYNDYRNTPNENTPLKENDNKDLDKNLKDMEEQLVKIKITKPKLNSQGCQIF